MAKYRILSEKEITEKISGMPDWSIEDGNIKASFELPGFKEAIAFIVQVGIVSEQMDHHPEFDNSYNKVSFKFCTHDAGYKLTDLDFDIAEKISGIARGMGA